MPRTKCTQCHTMQECGREILHDNNGKPYEKFFIVNHFDEYGEELCIGSRQDVIGVIFED